MAEKDNKSKATIIMIMFGITSVALYIVLYFFSPTVLELSAKGGWYFIVPVTIAFIFSYVHGEFTGRFWDVLGIKASKSVKDIKEVTK